MAEQGDDMVLDQIKDMSFQETPTPDLDKEQETNNDPERKTTQTDHINKKLTTNSGKSTISSMLQKALPATTKCICQDSYYYEPNSPLVPKDNNGYQNWERLDALDMEKMMRDIHSYIEERRDDPRPHLLIIEGIMIFNHRLLSQLFDKKYFIKISQGTCAERRSERIYNPPDPPGYFEAFVWPMYLKNLNDIQGQMDIEYLDGSDDLQTIFEKIFHDTLSLFTSSSRNNQPL